MLNKESRGGPQTDRNDAHYILSNYIEAKEKGTLPSYYLEAFRKFKDEYLDDLPKEDVRNLIEIDEETGLWKGLNYKCQGNYICGVSSWLKGAVDDSVITDIIIQNEIDTLRKHNFNFEQGKFTSQEEIDMINNVLDLVIDNLSE